MSKYDPLDKWKHDPVAYLKYMKLLYATDHKYLLKYGELIPIEEDDHMVDFQKQFVDDVMDKVVSENPFQQVMTRTADGTAENQFPRWIPTQVYRTTTRNKEPDLMAYQQSLNEVQYHECMETDIPGNYELKIQPINHEINVKVRAKIELVDGMGTVYRDLTKSNITIAAGNTLTLRDIQFKVDPAELMKKACIEISIAIAGFTDALVEIQGIFKEFAEEINDTAQQLGKEFREMKQIQFNRGQAMPYEPLFFHLGHAINKEREREKELGVTWTTRFNKQDQHESPDIDEAKQHLERPNSELPDTPIQIKTAREERLDVECAEMEGKFSSVTEVLDHKGYVWRDSDQVFRNSMKAKEIKFHEMQGHNIRSFYNWLKRVEKEL